MSEHHERKAPATRIERLLRRMSGPERIFVLIGMPLLILGGLQLVTQMAVSGLTGTSFTFLPVLTYLTLWGTANPAAHYGAAGASFLHWFLLSLIIAGIVALVVMRAKAEKSRAANPQLRRGLAPDKDVKEQLSTKQLLDRGVHLCPSLAGQKPHTIPPERVGYRIGSFLGMDVWIRTEDPVILIGPSRAGKGWRFLLGWILDAPGAVITTSVKLDNAKLTMKARERMGSRVFVWAPGIEGGKDLGHMLKWDPVDGCINEEVLMRRINGLIPADSFSGSTSNGGHWDTLGRQISSHLFHAAACGGLDVDAIWSWVGNPRRAEQAIDLIRNHPQGISERADQLEYILGMPPEQLATSWGVLPTVLAFMESRAAREWMKPSPEERVDLARFIVDRGTLYIVGDKMTSPVFVRMNAGLLAELDYITKALAAASPGSRLDPAVTYILDELGNMEYPGFYELITAGGGQGRVGIGVFQSKSQLDQYGDASTGTTLFDAAVGKLVLPGGGDPKALGDMAELVGSISVERESFTVGNGPASMQYSDDRRAIFEKEDIRTLKLDYAFLLYRNLKLVVPKTSPFNEHPRYEECMADAAAIDANFKQNSMYAEYLC